MSNTWTRRTLPPELRNLETWPTVDRSALSNNDQCHFDRYHAAIEDYLGGAPLRKVREKTGIATDALLKALNRCVTPAADGRIYGWRALVFRTRVKPYHRKASVGMFLSRGGLSGCFTQLLTRCDGLESELVSHIKKNPGKRDRIAEAGNHFSGIHHKFKELCIEKGIGPRDYPFNVVSQGIPSLRRFVRQVLNSDFSKGARLLGGRKAQSRAKVGTGTARLLAAVMPYDTWQLDEHRLDFIGVVRIDTPKGPQLVPISRLVLIPVADVNCPCIVGYHVAIRREPSAEEIVLAMASALGCWKPRELKVTYIKYKQGAGLPSGVIPQLNGVAAAELMIDNSLAHWSTAMTTRVREYTGMAINWGPIGDWVRRDVIERIFAILERRGFQRIPSTTGTGPGDPKVDDPVGKALKHKIELDELLDIIDVIIANFNASPTAALGGRIPLDVLREYLEFDTEGFLPRHLPPLPSYLPDMAVVVFSKTIRGSQKDGGRPYVELYYARYTSVVLSQAAALIGKRIRLHVHPQDPRTAMAFFEDGAELGVLVALGVWGQKPHTCMRPANTR